MLIIVFRRLCCVNWWTVPDVAKDPSGYALCTILRNVGIYLPVDRA